MLPYILFMTLSVSVERYVKKRVYSIKLVDFDSLNAHLLIAHQCTIVYSLP